LQRQQVKAILDGWEKNAPGRRQVMFRALMNTRPSHLLDSKLFDFKGLSRETEPFDENAMQLPRLR
jgi:tRNA 2-thiocytidine biosynthesis protein TtcA